MIPLAFYPLLFLTGLVAGFVDSIAGGGGLITVPVLLSFGLPPADALGTNKLQATFGSASATWHYARAGLVKFADCWTGILFTLLGATAGTLVVVTVWRVNDALLKQSIPWLLLAIALYSLFQPRLGLTDRPARMGRAKFHLLFGLAIGFYDGFFGPGTGSFWAMAYVVCLGFNLATATAYTKVMNFTSNLASLIVFLFSGHVQHVAVGVTMGIGQVLGARLGSRVVIRRGAGFVRPVFIGVVLIITINLLRQTYFAGPK